MLAQETKEDMETTKVTLDSEVIRRGSDMTSNNNVAEDAEEGEPQETEELLAKGRMSNVVYWKYFRSGGSIIMIISLLIFSIAGLIGSSGCDYWVGYW